MLVIQPRLTLPSISALVYLFPVTLWEPEFKNPESNRSLPHHVVGGLRCPGSLVSLTEARNEVELGGAWGREIPGGIKDPQLSSQSCHHSQRSLAKPQLLLSFFLVSSAILPFEYLEEIGRLHWALGKKNENFFSYPPKAEPACPTI